MCNKMRGGGGHGLGREANGIQNDMLHFKQISWDSGLGSRWLQRDKGRENELFKSMSAHEGCSYKGVAEVVQ